MIKKKDGEHAFTSGIDITNPSQITFWLDEYNDIFSDFDPRPYSQRSLSEDFLYEAKRASVDKEIEKIHLVLLVPEHMRKTSDEAIIKRRLTEHFVKHSIQIFERVKLPILRRGWRFVVAGVLLMFLASALFFNNDNSSLIRNFLIILVEPAGWFFLWDGLELILFESKKSNSDLEFYRKMATCSIGFKNL